MSMARRLVFATLGACVLCACGPAPSPGCAMLAADEGYCLRSSRAIPPFSAIQLATATMNGNRSSLIVAVEVDADGLRVGVLTLLGQKIMESAYDNIGVRSEVQGSVDKRLDPVMLLALIQMATWPSDEVSAGLTPSLRLVESGASREIRSSGRTLLTIERSGDAAPYRRLRIDAPHSGLRMVVETLPDDPPKSP